MEKHLKRSKQHFWNLSQSQSILSHFLPTSHKLQQYLKVLFNRKLEKDSSRRLARFGSVKRIDFKMLQTFSCWRVETFGWRQDLKWETGPITRVETDPDYWLLPDWKWFLDTRNTRAVLNLQHDLNESLHFCEVGAQFWGERLIRCRQTSNIKTFCKNRGKQLLCWLF